MVGRPGADAARFTGSVEHPAVVVGRARRLAKAVGNAAVDIQVVGGADQQGAGLARPIDASHLGVGVQAGVAIAGQVQVARHAQALARRAGQLDARTQVEGVLIGAQSR
ncbi:hypothetical protein D3C80_469320 [compost metagenome]